jgi:ABC-type nitrate/sulfonate/bicarbonate transport system ATPase subunit
MQYIKSNKQDRTVIMVTHSIDEVEFMNGNLIVMEQKAEG